MKRPKNYKDYSPALAFAISFCLHVLLLLGAYYLPIRQWVGSSAGYSIALHTAWKHPKNVAKGTTDTPPLHHQRVKEQSRAENQEEVVVENTEDKEETPEKASPALQETSGQDTPSEQDPTQDPPEAATSTSPEQEKKEPIDKRSLYKVDQDKQTGTFLELSGWIWDTVPQPQDQTDESGKIVLQIKIDESGEVIAVKTLEKTVSPLLEEVYKESLIGLTFSKTADNLVYAATSTGKVTFIVQVK